MIICEFTLILKVITNNTGLILLNKKCMLSVGNKERKQIVRYCPDILSITSLLLIEDDKKKNKIIYNKSSFHIGYIKYQCIIL